MAYNSLQPIKNRETDFKCKMKKSFKNYILFVLLLCFSPFQLLAQNEMVDAKVMQAYEWRMSGRTGEALQLLDTLVKEHPDNDLAYYELSRIRTEDKVNYLAKAHELTPENPMYAFDLANAYMLEAYKAFMQGDEAAAEEPLKQCFSSLKQVLAVKPDCRESLLFLIELNAAFEKEGSREEAEKYLVQLKKTDPVYGAQGNLILSDPEINAVDYWQSYMEENGKSTEAQYRQGMAALNMGDTDKAEEIFNEILKNNTSRNDLYLQLARGHLYKAMQGDDETRGKEMDQIKKYISMYLDHETDKIKGLEAWCYGWLSIVERKSGNEEQAAIFLEKATKIDPNFSRATALPPIKEDAPPTVISYEYKSYFRPF